ncbi:MULTISPECIES: hypothetical protein [Rhodococcus]|nr:MULTISPECIES: hypothetical protein [Rhodococcus]BDB58968.1 hypothetical protein RDE2_07620 [Rhodococcus sp. RDE2]
MPSPWDQLFDAQVLLRIAEQDGDNSGVAMLHQRITHLESRIGARD